jgi:hypothetical protein
MTSFKLLIDTNVIIGLEDAVPVQASLADLVRLSSEHSVGLFVDGANYDDVLRDKDVTRRSVTLSKLAKFQQLRDIPLLEHTKLVARFGAINSENDRSDVRLLAAIEAKAVDFLVTQDIKLHRRAARVGIGGNILTVEDAVQWLKRTFTAKPVSLPYVVERKAYEISRDHTILASLRADYPDFDRWFDKCRKEHRDCWTLEIAGELAGLVIRKDESHVEAKTRHPGPKILKICTFKVRDEFQGEKFGELLLKQVLWFAQRNRYDLIYLTAFPKQAFLIDFLLYYGLKETMKLPNGEIVLEKPMLSGALPGLAGPPFEFDREWYPRYCEAPTVGKFCVPILPYYHQLLFPEIAFLVDLPLFPADMLGPTLDPRQERVPGNTIRKVYLCRARTTRLRSGDMLFFYMSKDIRYAASQSITTLGIVEQVNNSTTTNDLIRLTAKRSVFSADDLRLMRASTDSPMKVIDFLLVGHIKPPVRLDMLLATGVFSNRPPQSITQLSEAKYAKLKPYIRLDFDA